MRLLSDLRKYPHLASDRKLYLIAFLTALSGFLSALDAVLPKPLPFLKLGLANLITLIIIMEGKNWLALQVAFYRTLVTSMILGTFLSYTHLLSVSGALGSVLMTIILYRLLKERISAVGLSVWGAFWSVCFQGSVVAIFYGFDRGLLLLLSIFLFIGITGGILIGFLARWFFKSVEEKKSLE